MAAVDRIEQVGKWLAIVSILIGVGAWVRQQDIRTESHERVIHETRKTHANDIDIVRSYIDEAEKRRAEEDSNLRALCSVEKLQRSYCETRGFRYGPDR